MKRLYSLIFLISVLVGTVQPILPMIEYQLHQGSIIELFGFGSNEVQVDCQMAICTMKDCCNRGTETDCSLLDLDYYPLALKITAIPVPHAFLTGIRFYLPSVKHVADPAFLPNPPPPRLS